MNWGALGAISETIGAIGVIASLLYVALQVRANTRASAVEAKLASTRFYAEFLDKLIESPELNDLFSRGRSDFNALERDDQFRFTNLALRAFTIFSANWFQYRQGTLNEQDWFEQMAIVNFWLRGAGIQQWWNKTGRLMFGSDFVNFIDVAIENTNA
ncbi:hypothetical protein N9145_01640 [bacterium]|jgi:hypothetical protein|nr:hypothetical protein [Pseudomonadales bacterium]MDB4452862.1 hypothetical protein [bacterium]